MDGTDEADMIQARVGHYVCNLPWDYYEIEATENGYGSLDNVSRSEWTNASSDHRILLTIADWYQYSWENEGTLNRASALLCNPSYAISNNQFIYDGNSLTARIESSESDNGFVSDLPGLPRSLLGSSVLSAISQVDTLDTTTTGLYDHLDPVFSLMQLQAKNVPIKQFFEPELFKSSFTEVFNGVAVQLAHQMLSNGSEYGGIVGAATFMQNRLHVTELSMGIMCAALGVLALISVGLVFLAPRGVVTTEPGSVLAIASSLEMTAGGMRVIKGLGHVRDKSLQRSLSPYLFDARKFNSIQTGDKIRLDTSAQQYAPSPILTAKIKNELQWWRPLGGERWFLSVSLAIPILSIGLLEFFQRQSNENNGFVEIHSQWGQNATNYVPAIISILIGAMLSSIVAASSIFAPYSSLVKAPTQSSRSVAINYVTQTGPRLGYSSLKNKHFGLSIIAFGQFIASILTIVLSGLYSITNIKLHGDVTVQQLDKFNMTGALSNSNPSAGLLTKMITYYDMKFPSWTYDSLVFPSITIVNTSILDNVQNATVNSRLPGLRGVLNCTTIATEDSVLQIQNMTKTIDEIRAPPPYDPKPPNGAYVPENGMNLIVTITRTLPTSQLCDNIDSRVNNNVKWKEQFFIRNDSTPSPFGRASILDWDLSGSGDSRVSVLEWEPKPETYGPTGCPSLAISLGKVTARWPVDNTTVEPFVWSTWTATDADIGTLVCWPKFEEFDVDTTLSWPSLEVPDHAPPRVQQSSLREVENPSSGSFAWYWNGVHDLWDGFKNTDDLLTAYGYLQNDTTFDPFILALLNGKSGVPLEQISGENNTEALLDRAQELWGRYMAQSISQNMREDADSGLPEPFSNDSTPIKANSESPSTTHLSEVDAILSDWPRRVKQNESSKVALQVMLGLMSLSVALTYFLVRFQEVLPHNPCSIAGTLSLVVDGNLGNMPVPFPGKLVRGKGRKRYTRLHKPDESDKDDQDTKRKFVMGWWNDGGIRKFGVRYAEDSEEIVMCFLACTVLRGIFC